MINELYQELILDHGRKPRNFRVPESPTHEADGFNPLCGDHVHVYATVVEGVIQDIAFQGKGCAISTASASMMTMAVKGMTVHDADALFKKFQAMVTQRRVEGEVFDEELENLEAMAGVREFPSRIKCATLAWHTMEEALHGTKQH